MARQAIPVGIGVHAGVTHSGSLGTADELTNISTIGDEVNAAARIAAQAAQGEILVSEAALRKAGLEGRDLDLRSMELKGINKPVLVRVMRGS